VLRVPDDNNCERFTHSIPPGEQGVPGAGAEADGRQPGALDAEFQAKLDRIGIPPPTRTRLSQVLVLVGVVVCVCVGIGLTWLWLRCESHNSSTPIVYLLLLFGALLVLLPLLAVGILRFYFENKQPEPQGAAMVRGISVVLLVVLGTLAAMSFAFSTCVQILAD
jgi:uncharacterized membrane protein